MKAGAAGCGVMGLAGKTWVRGRGVEGRLRDKPHTPPTPVLTGLCRWHRVAGFVGCGDHSPGRRGFAGQVRRCATTRHAKRCGDCVARMEAEGRNPGGSWHKAPDSAALHLGCLLLQGLCPVRQVSDKPIKGRFGLDLMLGI